MTAQPEPRQSTSRSEPIWCAASGCDERHHAEEGILGRFCTNVVRPDETCKCIEFVRPPRQTARYRTIVADPPWRYEEKLRMGSGPKHKGPAGQYGCMNYSDIRALPVVEMAEDNAHLYLWVTNAFLVEGHDLTRAWGFEPRAILTWVKPGIGTGPFFRTNTEHVIFGLRGRLALNSRSLPTGYAWRRGPHSAKPEAFYDLVEQASPGPYAELFARRARFGWDYWGDQSLGTAQMGLGLVA